MGKGIDMWDIGDSLKINKFSESRFECILEPLKTWL